MRLNRTIAPLALGLAVLAVAGCHSRPDQPTTTVPTPTRAEQAAPATVPARQARPPSPTPNATPAPAPQTIVGLWPVRTLAQARELQGGADAGHQPWLLSPELVAASFAAAQSGLVDPVARQVGSAAYQVGARGLEWVATVHLAQPVRRGAGGVWVVTRTANPAASY
jgi:hypothetical protein